MSCNDNELSLYDYISAGIFVLDLDYKHKYWNQAMTKITGLNISEADQLKFYKNDNDNETLDYRECLNDNKKVQRSIYIKTKDGEFKLVFVQSIIIEDIEKNIWATYCISDISKIITCSLLVEDNFSQQDANSFQNMIGKTKEMKEIYYMIKMAAESMANVLIIGESGTGKELIAKAIHETSSRKGKPYITVNCSALSENLLESELFGHVKGSFTGAYKDKIGKFEAAHEGTIFLDEIGDISPMIQLKLLRVIQEKTIVRIGENKEIKIDIRIIAATNKNLLRLVNDGSFREDLYYRLKVFSINTTPLRDRMNDVPLLCQYFIEKFNILTSKQISGFTDEALRLIMEYPWTGNVRELENAIEHAFVLCNDSLIDIFDLPQEVRSVNYKDNICRNFGNDPLQSSSHNGSNNKKTRNPVTKEELIEMLNDFNGSRTKTAEKLNISKVALWKKMKKFELI